MSAMAICIYVFISIHIYVYMMVDILYIIMEQINKHDLHDTANKEMQTSLPHNQSLLVCHNEGVPGAG